MIIRTELEVSHKICFHLEVVSVQIFSKLKLFSLLANSLSHLSLSLPLFLLILGHRKLNWLTPYTNLPDSSNDANSSTSYNLKR